MTDSEPSLRAVAEEIGTDADKPANTDDIVGGLTKLVDEYNVPLAEAERSLRQQYGATDTTLPEGVADLLDQLEDGHVAAVRTAGGKGPDDKRYVVAGRIELSEDLSRGWVATFHDATAWAWETGEPKTAEPYLDLIHDAGPPKAVRIEGRGDYGVAPGLHIDDGGLEVMERAPLWTHGNVDYYLPRPLGTVETINTGHIVEPKTLLPDAAEVDK